MDLQNMSKWILLATVCMRMALFCGSVKSNGVILDDLVERLGTTNTLVAGAFALQNCIAYIINDYGRFFSPKDVFVKAILAEFSVVYAAPFTTLLFEVFTSRQLCVVGGIMCGSGYIYLGFNLISIFQVYASYLASGIGYGLTTLSSYLKLQDYFKDEDLPLVISFIALFDFVGVAAVPPVLQYFRSNYGLENALILFGAVMWNIIVTGVAAREPKVRLSNKPKKTENENNNNLLGGSTVKTYLSNVFSVFEHTAFGFVLIIEFVSYYVFVSWALFLVSLGTTVGLTEVEAVSLSTIGGIGGLIGRICATLLFTFNKMTACTSSLIPIPIAGLAFFAITFSSNYCMILILTFVSGFCMGLNSSALFGLTPTIVCKDHYKHAVGLEAFILGIGTQTAGLLSGYIRDLTGSTVYVFMCNACVCFLLIPLLIFWKCNEKPQLNCRLHNTDRQKEAMDSEMK